MLKITWDYKGMKCGISHTIMEHRIINQFSMILCSMIVWTPGQAAETGRSEFFYRAIRPAHRGLEGIAG